MIAVEISGGLGNQLFQYAIGRRLALERGVPLYVDLLELENPDPQATPRRYRLDALHTQIDGLLSAAQRAWWEDFALWRRVARTVGRMVAPARAYWRIEEEQPYGYQPALLAQRGQLYLRGYWQHAAYADPIRATLRAELRPRDLSILTAQHAALVVQVQAMNSVAVHIRRGDYVTNPSAAARHIALPLSYYQQAAGRILADLPDAHFVLFSDDPAWVRGAWDVPAPYTVVDVPGADELADWWLMRACRHHIIANSSYSWWAAYLAEGAGQRVLAPRRWMRHAPQSPAGLLLAGWGVLD